jgi:hypothetical protein
MYLENSSPCLLCGVRELNFPIKTAWAHKCRVQYVCSVCGCYNLLATCLSSEICQFLTEIAHCHSILLSTCHLVNKAWKNLWTRGVCHTIRGPYIRILQLQEGEKRELWFSTLMRSSLLNPSNWFNNSNIVLWTSLSPLTSLSLQHKRSAPQAHIWNVVEKQVKHRVTLMTNVHQAKVLSLEWQT